MNNLTSLKFYLISIKLTIEWIQFCKQN